MSLSTHVLDTAGGQPAIGVDVLCEAVRDGAWTEVARGTTNEDGRIATLLDSPSMTAGPHRLVFDTGSWFAGQGQATFWLDIVVAFEVADPAEHHHVPLLLSPYGYSTYRGS